MIDLDIGGANLHTCLGVKQAQLTLSDFLRGHETDLNRLLIQTQIQRLQLVTGMNDALDVTEINSEKIQVFLKALTHLSCDVVILDLGAGTHSNTLDVALEADRQIVVVTPEPTSIENCYRFIKSLFYRKIRLMEKDLNLQQIVDEAMDQRNHLGIRSPFDLVKHLTKVQPEKADMIQNELRKIFINIIVNQTRSTNDIDLGFSITSVCRKYFGLPTQYLGNLEFDNAVWQSVRKQRPVVTEFPQSVISGQFLRIAKALLDSRALSAVV